MTTACRLCAHTLSHELIDLGHQPLANDYLEPTEQAIAAMRTFPLRVMICDHCFLVQVEEVVPPESVFKDDYAYYSSFSSSWVDHAKRYTDAMAERFALDADCKVVEIASNDGYLLQHFLARGVQCLGVEPAGNCAEEARKKGIPTVVEFFNKETAEALVRQGHSADLTAANNVLAHVPDISNFVAGFSVILKPDGVATFEFPHLLKMIAETQFDTIYHEHYSYLSLGVVEQVMSRHGLRVFDVEHLSTHGGSIRVFACREGARHEETKAVSATRNAENAACLNELEGYTQFAPTAEAMRDALRAFIDNAKQNDKRFAGYGAAAKGNTFLNYCGTNASDISFVVDRNPEKQGRLLPGSLIPVFDPAELAKEQPDLILILPWNLADEITKEHAYVADWGGRFFVAAPTLREL